MEEAGYTYTKSSISFQTPHLELGTGKDPLQQQLVHLRATAQTRGEFRKEEVFYDESVQLHFYVHWHIGLEIDIYLV